MGGYAMGAAAHILAVNLAVNPVPARSQMGSSLGFHIILACFGIAFAAVVMTAEWIGIKRGDAAAMLLARRWSKVMAVLVAVGAVSGTVLSYEMGLLWPGLMGRFGAAIGFPFSHGGDLLFPGSDLRRGVPVRLAAAAALGALVERDADRGVRAAGRLVGGRGELVDELTGRVHAHQRQAHQRRPGVGVLQRLDPVRDRAHGARRVHGGGIRHRRRLRGGAAARPPGPLPPAGLRHPVHDRRDPGPAAGDDGGHHRPVHRAPAAGQVRRDGIRPHDPARRSGMAGRDPDQWPGLPRRLHPGLRLDLGRVQPAHHRSSA